MFAFFLLASLAAAEVVIRGDFFQQDKHNGKLFECRRYGVKLSLTSEVTYVVDNVTYTRRIDFDALDDGSKYISRLLPLPQKKPSAADGNKAVSRTDQILSEDVHKAILQEASKRRKILSSSYAMMRSAVQTMLGQSVLILGIDSELMMGGDNRRGSMYLHGSFCSPLDAPIDDGTFNDVSHDVSHDVSRDTTQQSADDSMLPDSVPQWLREPLHANTSSDQFSRRDSASFS